MSFAWVDHTGEVELAITAESEQEVYGEAIRAVGELLACAGGTGARRQVRVEAPDRAARLAAFLAEIVFLAEAEGLVPERLLDVSLSGRGAAGVVEGRLTAPPHLIKGVTYHNLALDQDGDRWSARVVFDV